MDLNDYFDWIDLPNTKKDYIKNNNQLISKVTIHGQNNSIVNIENFDIAIFGLEDHHLPHETKGINVIRDYLYSLKLFEKSPKIVDLGNFKIGKTEQDTLIGLRDVYVELILSNVIPIAVGPSELITQANYLAYKKLDKKINLLTIDSVIRLFEDRKAKFKSALWKILIEDKDALFSYINIGYQSHFVGNNNIKFLADNLHLAYRLGNVKANILDVEPLLRDADTIGLNVSSVKQSDAFGQENGSPNGFTGEEICQLAQYSGMSSKLSAFGVFDYIVGNDINDQTAHLLAQVIWYFINGYIHKDKESPIANLSSYKKFIVNLDSMEYEIVFYKNEKSERWWMEVPSFKGKNHKNLLISCNYNDYQNACNGDVPDRWLKAFQKIN